MKRQSGIFMFLGAKSCTLTEKVSKHDYMNFDDKEVIKSYSSIVFYVH